MAEEGYTTDEKRRAAALLTSTSRREVEDTMRFLQAQREGTRAQPSWQQQAQPAQRPQSAQPPQQLPQIRAEKKPSKRKKMLIAGIITVSVLVLIFGIWFLSLLAS